MGRQGRGYRDAVISQGSLGLPGTEEAQKCRPGLTRKGAVLDKGLSSQDYLTLGPMYPWTYLVIISV